MAYLSANYVDGIIIGSKALAAGAMRYARIRQLTEAPDDIFIDIIEFDGSGVLTSHTLMGREAFAAYVTAGNIVLNTNWKEADYSAISLNAKVTTAISNLFLAGGFYRDRAPELSKLVMTPEARQDSMTRTFQLAIGNATHPVATALAARQQQQQAPVRNAVLRFGRRLDRWLYNLTKIQ